MSIFIIIAYLVVLFVGFFGGYRFGHSVGSEEVYGYFMRGEPP